MKNIIITIAAILSLNSCKSQNKVDLLQLKFGDNIEKIVSKENYIEEEIPGYEVFSFRTEVMEELKIGNTYLQTYQYPNANPAYLNLLDLIVISYESKEYLGFYYTTANQEEKSNILSYLKHKYENLEDRSDEYREAYFIDMKDEDAWLFINQNIGFDYDDNQFKTTSFIYVKRGTRVGNSKNPNQRTFLEVFNQVYPQKEK